jgi:signal peptidase I
MTMLRRAQANYSDPRILLDRPEPRVRALNRRRFIGNLMFAVGFSVFLTGWFFALRSGSLGGPATYVMVRGTSMNPTYHEGDLVITRRQHSYHLGDIVAYRIPGGQVGGGLTVIHRIVGGFADKGFVTKGDNNPAPDLWHPRLGQIEGKAWTLIPRAGRIILFLRAPIPLAAIAAAITVGMVIYRKSDPDPHPRRTAH